MASIVKRGNKYAVVYDYHDRAGRRKSKWESGMTKGEAELRKIEVELQLKKGDFLVPSDVTVEKYMRDWLPKYAMRKKWVPKTFTCNYSYMINHIIPHIGHIKLQKLRTKDIIDCYDTLYRTPKGLYKEGKRQKWSEEKIKSIPCLTSTTIKEVHDLLRCALSCAMDEELIHANPLPKESPEKLEPEQSFWDPATMQRALAKIEDPLIHLAVHCAYIGSLRAGEVMGITLSCIDFDYKDVGAIKIDKTLQRVDKKALEMVSNVGILFQFPTVETGKKSCLILKEPKTKRSKRWIYLTEPLREEIKERVRQIEKDKAEKGDLYFDYDLLFCLPNGRPIEPTLCSRWFSRWQQTVGEDLPTLKFHGIRHSSSTYKLTISNGDYKTVQGDTGHATADILLNTYGHIQEAERIKLAKKVSADFYQPQEVKKSPHKNEDFNLLDNLETLLKDNPKLQQQLLLALLAQNNNIDSKCNS